MRRAGHLWAKIVSFENLRCAARQARRGKRDRTATAAFEHDLERELIRLQEELTRGTYRPARTASSGSPIRNLARSARRRIAIAWSITPSRGLSNRSSNANSSITRTPVGPGKGRTGRCSRRAAGRGDSSTS